MFTHPTGLLSGGSPLVPVNLTISTNQCGYNYFTEAGSPTYPVLLTITVEAGVKVYNMHPGAGFPAGSQGVLINEGDILGNGGDGGLGGAFDTGTSAAGFDGEPGGNALTLGMDFEIQNGSGNIWGGGGGGGGGGASVEIADLGNGAAGGGGGGGVSGACGGGAAGEGGTSTGPSGTEGSDGNAATADTRGTGGSGGVNAGGAEGGNGGNGGDWGEAGGTAAPGGPDNPDYDGKPGGVGGAAGKAINLNGFTADIVSGGGSPNIKGAVS